MYCAYVICVSVEGRISQLSVLSVRFSVNLKLFLNFINKKDMGRGVQGKDGKMLTFEE